jgi:kynurenine formamidase
MTPKLDLKNGIDISIPYRTEKDATSAWYVGPMVVTPVVMGDWIGSVLKGGSVNFNDLSLNPHGNGTHTECVGHISKEVHSVNQHLKRWFFEASLVSIEPEVRGEDKVITLGQLQTVLLEGCSEAIIIRTLPNSDDKLFTNYSNSNPTYMEAEAADWLREQGVMHLLIDLPSVDREEDGGALAAHKAFWNYPEAPRMEATITELIYVPEHVADGRYLLNLQVAPIENDASPSRPVLYSV